MRRSANLEDTAVPGARSPSSLPTVDVGRATEAFAEQASTLAGVRAILASVTDDGRLDIWAVLYAPNRDVEHTLFEYERTMESAHPELRFDYGLLYRGRGERFPTEEWSAAGWTVLFDGGRV